MKRKKKLDEDRWSLIGGMRLLLNDAWSCLKCIRSDIKVIKCKEKTSYIKISFNLSTIFVQNYSKMNAFALFILSNNLFLKDDLLLSSESKNKY